MAYTVTLQPDGNIVSNLREELVVLQPAAADYATGGYSITGSDQNPTGFNVGLWKVLFVDLVGSSGGTTSYIAGWNSSTNKLQFYTQTGAAGPLAEVAAGTDLSAFSFLLKVSGL